MAGVAAPKPRVCLGAVIQILERRRGGVKDEIVDRHATYLPRVWKCQDAARQAGRTSLLSSFSRSRRLLRRQEGSSVTGAACVHADPDAARLYCRCRTLLPSKATEMPLPCTYASDKSRSGPFF
jgi:hypothetical protein